MIFQTYIPLPLSPEKLDLSYIYHKYIQVK